ncbi:hypothetical protein GGS20DRAFT_573734 [Poronia punctata]|nr:hypothetical protein GGS20DRAFT_573734 [Poronia punctata]
MSPLIHAITALLSGLGVLASPLDISPRQATQIPPNVLYLIEWWPQGCGRGNGATLSGHDYTLATCQNLDAPADPADDAAVRFLFPDDGATYKWKVFGTSDCSQQIAMGETGEDGCFTVPIGSKVGAVIVYT